ncbi:FAD-dependent monooxygenase [Cohaesibacter celericrescens]|uniref:Monooxygenase n=1 Tax=Cohaesibacter celericrescens TaxID=2067669 RepID=A0A2N5XWC8_9HYPH|nr:FAD-dependent monooxygenase [Cohaesibacter celericrescens]PLW78728.1 monooxygenase [Cohaesibacter celericrescens]
MSEQLPIIIVGAGPGGLATALALAHKNIPVLLLEKNQMPTEVGAGIQISPNATSSLKQWGVWPYIAEQAVIPGKIKIRSGVSGALLSELSARDISARYGAPYMVVHRADMQQALYHRASQLALIEMQDECDVQDIKDTADGIEVTCTLASGEQRSFKGSALIAADGVWSRIGTTYFGNKPAAYSGKTAWRTTLPLQMVPDTIDSRNIGLWLSPNAHLVHYPIVGGHMMNIVAIVNEDWTEEGWNGKGDADWLNNRFARWPREIRELLVERQDWLKWALCGQDPEQAWVKGKVALTGDAAHAMLPFMAQGAVMAIEDAAILARAIDEVQGPMETRLKAYEKARKNRVRKVVAKARRNGEIYHMQGAIATARNMTMRLLPTSQLMRQFDWIYSWKPEDVSFDA